MLCFFYNMGGCYKPDGTPKQPHECAYAHIKTSRLFPKPQKYRMPCRAFYLENECTDPRCTYGHTTHLSHFKRQKFLAGMDPDVGKRHWSGAPRVAGNLDYSYLPDPYRDPDKLIAMVTSAVKTLGDNDDGKKMVELITVTVRAILDLM